MQRPPQEEQQAQMMYKRVFKNKHCTCMVLFLQKCIEYCTNLMLYKGDYPQSTSRLFADIVTYRLCLISVPVQGTLA